MTQPEKRKEPISTTMEWSYDLLEEYYREIEKIAKEKLNLNVYPNQLEIISSEQMLEAYATHALPMFYDHWSTGMRFVEEMEHYKRGRMGLAYEVVINSSPCIAYLMEENSMLMQILVMAHASFGHNHFFKNNYLFKQWTDAEAIIDYLAFIKKFVRDCEESQGPDAVEEVFDACHALQYYGVDKYKRPREMTRVEREEDKKEREIWEREQINVLWSTIPVNKNEDDEAAQKKDIFPTSSQENLLYFIEKNAPNMPVWKRELVRIVRKLSQYFYPQMQTKLMNEGFATFSHYTILNEMYDRGLIGDGYMLEFLQSHTNVTTQRDYDQKGYGGLNVYSLGFAMFRDIQRVSMDPTEEDRQWFFGKDWVGNGKWLENILWAVENFKDESFVLEFLSPKIMRDYHLFVILDDDRDTKLEVTAIHNDRGYKKIREALAHQYSLSYIIPEIQVAKGGVDRWATRSLTLEHIVRNRRILHDESTIETLKHLRTLWGYDVILNSKNTEGRVEATYSVSEEDTSIDVFLHNN